MNTPLQVDKRGPGWTPARRLDGKVAVVIGAGQSPGDGLGNGRATAIRFAREGARVLAVDRRIESAEETAALIRNEGFDCVAHAADVTREPELAAAMQEAHQRWGSLDILYNNVGVSLGGGDAQLQDITEEAFDNVYRINLRGTAFACKQALKIMREQRSGAIVNMASAAAVENFPYVAYKATKAAVIALTQQLAIQNAPYGIRANCIAPGFIATDMTGALPENVRQEWEKQIPLRRGGTPEDVAGVAVFLASDLAGYVTGQVVNCCGGMNC